MAWQLAQAFWCLEASRLRRHPPLPHVEQHQFTWNVVGSLPDTYGRPTQGATAVRSR